jgi:hypothetical protein
MEHSRFNRSGGVRSTHRALVVVKGRPASDWRPDPKSGLQDFFELCIHLTYEQCLKMIPVSIVGGRYLLFPDMEVHQISANAIALPPPDLSRS